MPMGEKQNVNVNKSTVGAADVTRRILCGGIAGMVAKTATAPLERIKMISQTGEHGVEKAKMNGPRKPIKVLELYKSIVRSEGVIGLWAGNGANLLRVFPAKGIVFASNDVFKSSLKKLAQVPDGQLLTGSLSFLAGGLSGMTASAVTYPLDFARGRISGKVEDKNIGKRHYSGIWVTIYRSVKEEGIFTLYKGVTPTLLGAVPYEGIKFGTVGLLERWFPLKDDERAPVWRKIVFGGAGGVMAGLITYPNDTVRRMLQLQGSKGTTEVFTGYWDCVRKTFKSHGIQRFYHGVVINLIRMAPNTAIQFGSYEILKRLTEKVVT